MKKLFFFLIISVLFFGCKKDDDNLNTSNNSTNSAFDKPCNFFGMEYYNCSVTYTWDNGSGTTTTTEECAFITGNGGGDPYGRRSYFNWDNIDLDFCLPEDSTTLSNLEINTTNQPFGTSIINTPNEFDNYFSLEIDDDMGVEWSFPNDTSISGAYYHRFTSLDHQRDDNEIVWKIEGEFSTFVVNPNDNSQSRNVSGNYTIYQNTNRL